MKPAEPHRPDGMLRTLAVLGGFVLLALLSGLMARSCRSPASEGRIEVSAPARSP